MAEYIDREKALADLKESADYHAQDSREWQLLLRDRNILREQATIDVIERSKIDKAIEEIQEQIQPHLVGGRNNGKSIRYGMALALKILKRNIGE